MKFMLITDSRDALTGMRLAGIEGVLVHSAQEAEAEIKKCSDDDSIGVVLLTEGAAKLCAETVDAIRLGSSRPLIVTVPGSADEKSEDNIMRCVREAIGIKI